VPHIAGVPRYMFRTGARSFADMVRGRFRNDAVAAFEHELWLWFFAGVIGQRWKDRRGSSLRTEH
jgi:hypothetical protein